MKIYSKGSAFFIHKDSKSSVRLNIRAVLRHWYHSSEHYRNGVKSIIEKSKYFCHITEGGLYYAWVSFYRGVKAFWKMVIEAINEILVGRLSLVQGEKTPQTWVPERLYDLILTMLVVARWMYSRQSKVHCIPFKSECLDGAWKVIQLMKRWSECSRNYAIYPFWAHAMSYLCCI